MLGSLPQYLTTLTVKIFFLLSSLNPPFIPCRHVYLWCPGSRKAHLLALSLLPLGQHPPCHGPPNGKDKWHRTATDGCVPLCWSTYKCFSLSALRNHTVWGDFVFVCVWFLFSLGLLIKRGKSFLISSCSRFNSTVSCPKKLLFSRHRENDVYEIQSTGIFFPLWLEEESSWWRVDEKGFICYILVTALWVMGLIIDRAI